MKVFRYILLTLILLNIPSFSLVVFGTTLGALTNALLFLGLILYFFLEKKGKPIIPLIVLGITYFTISSFNYSGIVEDFIKDAIRYFVFIIGAVSLVKKTNDKTLLLFLLVGALSVLINAIIFPNSYGRYSGLYLNPNRAGLICLFGFSLTYIIDKINIRLAIQFIFILAGIVTLSRYFILLLVIIYIISIFVNRKNFVGIVVGAIAFFIILSTSSFRLNADRFGALKSVFSGDTDVKTITKESREETWALYQNIILSNPIIGVGYQELQGTESKKVSIKVGVHNTYLMIIGESGIIPFLLLIIIYLTLIIRSSKHIKKNQEFVYMALILTTFLLVSHNYFDNYIILFSTVWLYNKVKDSSQTDLV